MFSNETVPICSFCPAGFMPLYSTSCVACPLGRFSALGHTQSNGSCAPCASGTEPNMERADCVSCPAGSYSNSSTSFICSVCGPGQQPSANQSRCMACAQGFYSNTSTGFLCARCPDGWSSIEDRSACNITSATEALQNCSASNCSVPAAAVLCNSGFGHAPNGSCVRCSTNTYSNASTQFNCTFCSFGFEPSLNQSFCVPCAEHSYYYNGSDLNLKGLCLQCPAGTEISSQGDGCAACESGKVRNETMVGGCVSCSDGFEPNVNRTSCVKCRLGSISNQTLPQCHLCEPGTAPSDDQSRCIECPVNTYSNGIETDFTCIACPEGFGTATSARSSNCTACLSNRYPSGICNVYCDPVSNCSGHGICNLNGSCKCSLNFTGSQCNVCRANLFPQVSSMNNSDGVSQCSRFCQSNTTCSGHGYCSPLGLCVCDPRFKGEACDVCNNDNATLPSCDPPQGTPSPPPLPAPPPTIPDKLPPVGGDSYGDASQAVSGAAASSAVASSSASGSSLQVLDAIQNLVRFACLRVEFPLWYIEVFVQGFSVILFGFQIGFLRDVGDPIGYATQEVDYETDSSLKIFLKNAHGTFSESFESLFLAFMFSMFVIFNLFLIMRIIQGFLVKELARRQSFLRTKLRSFLRLGATFGRKSTSVTPLMHSRSPIESSTPVENAPGDLEDQTPMQRTLHREASAIRPGLLVDVRTESFDHVSDSPLIGVRTRNRLPPMILDGASSKLPGAYLQSPSQLFATQFPPASPSVARQGGCTPRLSPLNQGSADSGSIDSQSQSQTQTQPQTQPPRSRTSSGISPADMKRLSAVLEEIANAQTQKGRLFAKRGFLKERSRVTFHDNPYAVCELTDDTDHTSGRDGNGDIIDRLRFDEPTSLSSTMSYESSFIVRDDCAMGSMPKSEHGNTPTATTTTAAATTTATAAPPDGSNKTSSEGSRRRALVLGFMYRLLYMITLSMLTAVLFPLFVTGLVQLLFNTSAVFQSFLSLVCLAAALIGFLIAMPVWHRMQAAKSSSDVTTTTAEQCQKRVSFTALYFEPYASHALWFDAWMILCTLLDACIVVVGDYCAIDPVLQLSLVCLVDFLRIGLAAVKKPFHDATDKYLFFFNSIFDLGTLMATFPVAYLGRTSAQMETTIYIISIAQAGAVCVNVLVGLITVAAMIFTTLRKIIMHRRKPLNPE
eukprot:ANDGO_08280.mRNA.1 hypothetical protein